MSVQTMAAVWKGSQHGGSALLMMLAIADFSDDKGVAYPAVSTLAAKTRMKTRNAHYLLGGLQESGELVIKRAAGPRGTNLYRIALDRLNGVHAAARVHHSAGVQPVAGVQPIAGVHAIAGVHQIAAGDATQCAPPLHPSAPEPSLNHQEPPDTSPARPAARGLECPQQQIRALYAEILPSLPQPKKWDADRAKALRARWRAQAAEKGWGCVDEGLQWFRRFFEAVSENDWAMGRSGRGKGHESWECDIDYLLTVKGFRRIIESAGRARETA